MELKGRVLVYSVLGCPHCMQAKNSLQECDIPYTDVRLDQFPRARPDMQLRTGGKRTVPQIFFNNHHIEGNHELQELMKDKEKLNSLLEELKTTPVPFDAPPVPDMSTAADSSDPGDIECEPDEYAELVKAVRKSGIIKDQSTHKNVFTGKDFVDWVVNTNELDRERAIEMGQSLIDSDFGRQLNDKETFQDADVYYKLLEDDDASALNSGDISTCAIRPVSDLGEDIRKLILKIYSSYLSEGGKKVDYAGIRACDEFQRYIRLTKELQRVKISEANREEKLAFFINIYNALFIHANIKIGRPTILTKKKPFFKTVSYMIGGLVYSLNDIENGVLRANRKGHGEDSKPFGQSNLRLKVALTEHEPLIHFALVCGDKSCPPLKTYSVVEIYDQLNLAAEAFLEGDDGCTVATKTIKLSRILKWYSEDFGNNKEEVVQWVHEHMGEGTKKSELGELLNGESFELSHMWYNYNINS